MTITLVTSMGRRALMVAVVTAVAGMAFVVVVVAAPVALLWGTGAILLGLLGAAARSASLTETTSSLNF